jgi:outer membrane protein insertion porin family
LRSPLALASLLLLATLGVPDVAVALEPCPQQLAPEQQPAPAADPIVRRIVVRGNRRYTEEQLVSALGQTVGAELDRAAIERGLETLWNTFRVRADVASRPADGEGVELLLSVTEMAVDFEPRFSGNAEVGRDELLEWAGLTEDSELYLFQAPRVRERILDGYRDEGFAFAEVRIVERRPEPGQEADFAPDVIFEIREGPEVKVRDIVVTGSTAYPDRGWGLFRSGLRKLASTELRPPRLFSWFSKDFVREDLDADVLSMRGVYRESGYLDAVVEVERLEFDRAREWVTIHIAVDEGPRYEVASLSIEGVERYVDMSGQPRVLERPADLVLPEEKLLELCELQVGGPFEQRLVNTDRSALRKRYGRRGHIEHHSLPPVDRWAFLEPELVLDPTEPKVHVVYRIAQGRQQFIREIKVVGNLHTEDRVIRRLVTVEPGNVADLDEIRRSRARIQGTGFFSDSRNPVEHREPDFLFEETGDPAWKDLVYVVQEGEVLTLNVSGGISTNTGAFGVLALTHRNFDITKLPSSPWEIVSEVGSRRAFHGAGQELRAQISPGTQVSFFDLYFREPDVFGSHKNRISLILNANRRLRRYDSHDEERTENSIQLGRQLSPDSTVFVSFARGEVSVEELDEGGETSLGNPYTVPVLLKDQEGDLDLGSVGLSYRRRTVDSRLNPRHGDELNLGVKLYGESLGSDAEFLRFDARYDWYEDVGDNDDLALPRVHIGLRAGASVPLGDDENVPYSERFFLGGQRLLRGFDFRGVGPNENGFPIGGETMLFGTLEYRVPLLTNTQPGTFREIEMFHGGLFLDVGVLDPDDFSLDLGETRMSAGFLFGLTVPVPITFSVGFDIRSGAQDDLQVVGFNLGL